MFDKKILYVDYYDQIRETAVEYLVSKGFKNVFQSGDYDETLQIITKEQPDVILIEIYVGIHGQHYSENGIEIIRKTKAELSPKSYILVATADFEELYGDKCKKAGADDYMEKPIHLRELFEKIKAILSK